MSNQPLSYFAKRVFKSSLGKKAAIASVVWGVLSGSVLPLGVASFMELIGTPQAPQLARWLIVLLVAICIARMCQERLCLKAINSSKTQGRMLIAIALGQCPPPLANEPSETIVSRFLNAQQTAFIVLLGEVIRAAVNLLGFVIVLVFFALPWWVYAVVIAVIVSTIGAYWLFKSHVLFVQAGDLESRVGQLMAQLRSSRNNTQVHGALHKAIETANQKAFEARMKSIHYTITRFLNIRNITNALICSISLWVGSTADIKTAALLVMFMFSFSGHVETIHNLAGRCEVAVSDGKPMLDVVNQPIKPILHVRADEPCLQTKNTVVRYTDKDGVLQKEVSVQDFQLSIGGIYVFTGVNGSGKSSLFKAVVGEADYSGKLLLWGQEARDFDASRVVVSFSQVRPLLDVTAEDLLKEYATDSEAMQYALQCVNGQDIDLSRLHNELSGGLRQKIDMALVIYRCIVERERVRLLLVDEPSNHLDNETIALMRKWLTEFLTTRIHPSMAVLIATHDPRLQGALLALPRAKEIQ